ncbi:MAG: hypothetical protein IKZ82_10010 [Clostridia bacterium]|nr:hypothetical protein [Clostridia bacterium]
MKKSAKTLARTVMLLLIAAMLLSALVACGKKSDAELILGKWTSELDMSSLMRKAAQSDDSALVDLSDIDFSGLVMKISYEFEKDGSVKAVADEESGKNIMKKMASIMGQVFKKMFMAEDSGVSEEDVLKAYGVKSWDELGELLVDKDDIDFGGLTGSGTYKLEDGKLIMTLKEGDNEVKETVEYTLSGSELKFTSLVSDDMDEEDIESLKAILPIVFKKG